MNVQTAELEGLSWRLKTKRFAAAPPHLTSTILGSISDYKLPDDPMHTVLRVLGTEVLVEDTHIAWLSPPIATQIKMALINWVDSNYGGNIRRAYRDSSELQWDGTAFWFTTFP